MRQSKSDKYWLFSRFNILKSNYDRESINKSLDDVSEKYKKKTLESGHTHEQIHSNSSEGFFSSTNHKSFFKSSANSSKSTHNRKLSTKPNFSASFDETENDWDSEIGYEDSDNNTTGPLYRDESQSGKAFKLKTLEEIDRISENPLSIFDFIASEREMAENNLNTHESKMSRFKRILQAKTIEINNLRRLAWNGIPSKLRPIVWQVLLGYLPQSSDRRASILSKKRKEYLSFVTKLFGRGTENLNRDIWHQIHIDVPRTNPKIALYQFAATQRCLERVLYSWAIRHPASGYVQGINDLVTPFFQVFASAYIESEVEEFDPSYLPIEVLDKIEADCYWCLCKLLDNIQENYIFAQPGIHKQVLNLQELVNRIDLSLANHLSSEGVEFMQFSFRWMNCLLMRELKLKHIIRMWDTYLAEGPTGFSEFHLYVCAAFLVTWSEALLKMDFQNILIFLQSVLTAEWSDKQVELLLSEAFLWKSIFSGSIAHLKAGVSTSQGL